MKIRYILQIGAGLLVAAVGIALPFSGAVSGIGLYSALVAAGTVMVMMGALNHRRFGDGIESDERTQSIGGMAASWSWFATLLLICALFRANELGVFTPEIGSVFAGLIFFMAITAGAFSWYFAHRVERA
ncbi:MAG: hypothetical protein PWP08_1854 [Methanofollis sp.]|nr:hypothetical protein [Methanofollis sp.]